MNKRLGLLSFLTMFFLSTNVIASDSYFGFGFTIQKKEKEDYVLIIDVAKNSPAERAGIRVGEMIESVDKVSVVGLELEEVSALFKTDDIDKEFVFSIKSSQTGPSRIVSLQKGMVKVDCLAEGNLSLRYSGFGRNGDLTGYIGNEYIRLNHFGTRVTGYINGEYVSLWFEERGPRNPTNPNRRMDRFEVRGYIKSTYITWRGWGGRVTGWQDCIK